MLKRKLLGEGSSCVQGSRLGYTHGSEEKVHCQRPADWTVWKGENCPHDWCSCVAVSLEDSALSCTNIYGLPLLTNFIYGSYAILKI